MVQGKVKTKVQVPGKGGRNKQKFSHQKKKSHPKKGELGPRISVFTPMATFFEEGGGGSNQGRRHRFSVQARYIAPKKAKHIEASKLKKNISKLISIRNEQEMISQAASKEPKQLSLGASTSGGVDSKKDSKKKGQK